ncbi:S-adenosyl-L-methionine-dependent methyltransferase [Aspergillus pseudoustus]|uniref:S-adenosyl-L-methionine-dependent methyltransferase n=1 Tax=Aspergillus pseudoustus TaxID=1810923 RepID=A0ABR4JAJ4_9EURO
MSRVPPDEYLARAYALSTTTEARTLYNEWSSLYDTDLNSAGYASPRRAVETVLKYLPTSCSQTTSTPRASEPLKILDAGCGTGLVGTYISTSTLSNKSEFTLQLDGLDLSEGMLSVAREKNVYSSLTPTDLNDPIPKPSGTYDVVICVGTLTEGHVGPNVLGEFVRVAAAETGIVVVTVHDKVWVSMGFKAEVERLEKEGRLSVLATEEFGILDGESKGGRMVVLRRA